MREPNNIEIALRNYRAVIAWFAILLAILKGEDETKAKNELKSLLARGHNHCSWQFGPILACLKKRLSRRKLDLLTTLSREINSEKKEKKVKAGKSHRRNRLVASR
jgi:hypothetical protein